eukprot:m51a1_g912 hypothetical protein (111) ;mRNA; r:132779-134776
MLPRDYRHPCLVAQAAAQTHRNSSPRQRTETRSNRKLGRLDNAHVVDGGGEADCKNEDKFGGESLEAEEQGTSEGESRCNFWIVQLFLRMILSNDQRGKCVVQSELHKMD